MIDIRNGDILVVDGREYPVRAAAAWSWGRANEAGFRRLAVKTASTKRSPQPVAGQRGAAVANLAGLVCTPLDPVDAETRARLLLEGPVTALETYVLGDGEYMHVVVEDLRR